MSSAGLPSDRQLVILDRQQVEQCLSQIPLDNLLSRVREAFESHWQQRSQTPERIQIDTETGTTLFMPSEMRSDRQLLGIKIVSVMPQNQVKYGLPNVPGFSIAIDPQNGLPRALMDASVLTGVRTAAGSALSLKLCHDAHRATGEESMLVFGAGMQAFWHIILCVHVLKGMVKEVVICNRTRSKAHQLAQQLVESTEHKEFKFVLADSTKKPCSHLEDRKRTVAIRVIDMEHPDAVNDQVSRSQVICLCTNSPSPLFDGKHIQPGTHVMCVGSYKPTNQEVDAETITRARVIADSVDDVWRESGDLIIPLQQGLIQKNHILGSIAQVSLGQITPRQSSQDITLFKSVGVAVTDTAVSDMVCEYATKESIGTWVSFP